jgi:energy-coupling factor transporter ATP-binding protein EcfA2
VKISRIKIGRWRNLADFEVEFDPNAEFICLVGENGAGKSNLLEAVAYAAPHLGLTTSVSAKRPFPPDMAQPANIAITLDLEDDSAADGLVAEGIDPTSVGHWDGTLTFQVESHLLEPEQPPPPPQVPQTFNSHNGTIYTWGTVLAGGVPDINHAYELASRVIARHQQSERVLHLYIDAERVFPEFGITDAEVLERARQDHRAPAVIRQQATLATQNLYTEWMRSMLGERQRMQGEYYNVAQEASRDGKPIPSPTDPLNSYREALRSVLPHLEFKRLDLEARRLIFDSAGQELVYEHLSGGERELAFLIGQMERFGVKDGIFLLDEPELHLNAELLQRWLGYLRSSTATGQVLIATHSLEAVEAAGLASTFTLERDEDRIVRRAEPLGERPALVTLAPLLGTPAFSISASTFVLIEGERAGRERERFVQVTGAEPVVRFIEAGGCKQVAARLAGLLLLAEETDEQVRAGAFVDRDHRSDEQVAAFEAAHKVSVLRVHEIENYFLHPDLLDALSAEGGGAGDGHVLLREAADPRAGEWVWRRALYQQDWREVPDECLGIARGLTWEQIAADVSAAARTLLDPYEKVESATGSATQRRAALAAAVRSYHEAREDREQLWKVVEGKETLVTVADLLGFKGPEALEGHAFRLWRDGEVGRPPEVESLNAYIDGLVAHG